MIRKAADCPVEVRENMRGGDGTVEITNFVTKDELYQKGRLFSKIRLAPGCGIGYHIHESDSEIFYFTKGTAKYSDNGEWTTVGAGDVAVTPKGHGHSVINETDSDVELIALIVYA